VEHEKRSDNNESEAHAVVPFELVAQITFHNAAPRCFRCPYQAMVMKILENVSSSMVRI
jgi:hypothetical protein